MIKYVYHSSFLLENGKNAHNTRFTNYNYLYWGF